MKLLSWVLAPSITHPYVSMLIKGLGKAELHLAPTRLPLTTFLLARCVKIPCSGFLLAFFGFLMLRIPTLTHLLMTPLHVMLLRVLLWNCWQSWHCIRWSYFSHPIFLFKFISEPLQTHPITRHQTLAHFASTKDALFITESGRVGACMWFCHNQSGFIQVGVFSSTLFQALLPHSNYYTAASQGSLDHIIKVPWSSQAYNSYINSHLSDIQWAHSKIVQ